MSNRLFVGNLSFDTTEDALRAHFSAEGREVTSVRVMLDRETGRPRGFAFVDVRSAAGIEAVISEMDGSELEGRRLRVNEAAERPARPQGGDRPRAGERGAAPGGFDRPRGGDRPGPSGGSHGGGGFRSPDKKKGGGRSWDERGKGRGKPSRDDSGGERGGGGRGSRGGGGRFEDDEEW